MHVGHALAQGLPQRLVRDLVQEGRDVLRLRVEEPVGLVVRRGVGQQVDGGQPGLLPAGDEHDHGLAGRMFQDGVVGRLGHGHNPARVVGHREPLDVELQRNWSHLG